MSVCIYVELQRKSRFYDPIHVKMKKKKKKRNFHEVL